MSADKVTIIHCLSHLRRQAGREVAAHVQYRGRGTASDQQRRTHAQAGSYTSVHAGGQTKTHKGTKREKGVSGNGLGTQPQQWYYSVFRVIEQCIGSAKNIGTWNIMVLFIVPPNRKMYW